MQARRVDRHIEGQRDDRDEGFNAAMETYEDLVKAGVIDPAKVDGARRKPRVDKPRVAR
jgi:chaperonin GroEL (HSP60 family)